jgi:hypothetical protein
LAAAGGMSDQDLAAFLGIDRNDPLRPALARIRPRLRALIEHMAEIEAELAAWEAGRAPNRPRAVSASSMRARRIRSCLLPWLLLSSATAYYSYCRAPAFASGVM